LGLLSSIADFVTGKSFSSVVPVSVAMQEALEVRGQPDPDRLPVYLSTRPANWTDIADPLHMIATARNSVVVYACFSYLTDAVAESPTRVYRLVAVLPPGYAYKYAIVVASVFNRNEGIWIPGVSNKDQMPAE
jgi:hypothetical protein